MSRRAGSSFHAGFRLLPAPKRRAMEALYAFLRFTDDLADGPATKCPRREALAAWRTALSDSLTTISPLLSGEGQGVRANVSPLLSGEGQGVRANVSPLLSGEGQGVRANLSGDGAAASILPALCDAVRTFRIPHEHLFAVLDGVEMDLDAQRYETFDQLRLYCQRVASAVGLACIHIWGFHGCGKGGAAEKGRGQRAEGRGEKNSKDRETRRQGDKEVPLPTASPCLLVSLSPPSPLSSLPSPLSPKAPVPGSAFSAATSAGIALQLTNILRDLKDDVAAGRVYLPDEDFRACGYRPEDLRAGVADERFHRLMCLEVSRAESFYREAAELLDWLEPPGRRVFGLMMATYRTLLRTIAGRPAAVFGRRIRLSPVKRLQLLARWSLLPPRKGSLR